MQVMSAPTYEVLDTKYVLTSDGLVNVDTAERLTVEEGLQQGIIRLVGAGAPSLKASVEEALAALGKISSEKIDSLVVGVIYRQGPNEEKYVMIDLVGMNQDVANVTQEVVAEVNRKQHDIRRPLH